MQCHRERSGYLPQQHHTIWHESSNSDICNKNIHIIDLLMKRAWNECNICWQHSSHLQIQNNAQRSLTVMLVMSKCQLWNAVNKMPRSRVFALLCMRMRVKNRGGRKTKYLIISSIPIWFFSFYVPGVVKPSFSLVWPYLRIHCHPCPHCLRLTGQTSADQGLYCARTVSVTNDTSLQITHVSQQGKKSTLYDLFLLCVCIFIAEVFVRIK